MRLIFSAAAFCHFLRVPDRGEGEGNQSFPKGQIQLQSSTKKQILWSCVENGEKSENYTARAEGMQKDD
jgi:hypothetical protein